MSDYSELLSRLRADYGADEPDTLETEAADAIAALLQERATLVEALGCLASLAEVADVMDEPGRVTINRARTAIATVEGKSP